MYTQQLMYAQYTQQLAIVYMKYTIDIEAASIVSLTIDD
jgi:hypothetical protein